MTVYEVLGRERTVAAVVVEVVDEVVLGPDPDWFDVLDLVDVARKELPDFLDELDDLDVVELAMDLVEEAKLDLIYI